MDQLQARDEMLAVPEALPLAPASGGLLHVANTPTMLSLMPDSINGHAGGAGRNLGRVTPVPDSLQKPAGRTGVSSAPLTPLPSGEQGQLLKFARQQLQFTAFYPREVAVEHWQTLLVYTHVPAALGVVREDAQRVKDQPGAGPVQVAEVEPSTAGGTQMTVVPLFPGVTFQPERISFPLTSTWQPAVLRFSVERGRIGTVATGEILLLAGPLIIAVLRVALRCVEPGARTDLAQEEVSVARYKNICISYSQEDTSIVQALQQAYGALGDESFQDIEALRSGANWQSIMPRAIDGADVFQLFWSPNAAQSQLVYQECQYTLQHYKYDGFMRPIYWQKPLGFCPPEFAHLAFTYYDLI
jgi:hypothetical protein